MSTFSIRTENSSILNLYHYHSSPGRIPPMYQLKILLLNPVCCLYCGYFQSKCWNIGWTEISFCRNVARNPRTFRLLCKKYCWVLYWNKHYHKKKLRIFFCKNLLHQSRRETIAVFSASKITTDYLVLGNFKSTFVRSVWIFA